MIVYELGYYTNTGEYIQYCLYSTKELAEKELEREKAQNVTVDWTIEEIPVKSE